MIFPLTAQGAITGSLFVFIPSLGNFVDPRAARRRQDGDARHARPRPVPEGPELAVRLDDRPRRARLRRRHRRRPERRREALERDVSRVVCASTSPSSTASCSCRSPCSSCCRSTAPACRRRGAASPRRGTARCGRNEEMREGLRNTLIVAVGATIVATVLGTLLAVGMQRYVRSRIGRGADPRPGGAPRHRPRRRPADPLHVPRHDARAAQRAALACPVLHGVRDRRRAGPAAERRLVAGGGGPRPRVERAGIVRAHHPAVVAAPGIIAGALLAFTLSLDEFVIAFFTNGPTTPTLPQVIYSNVRFGVKPDVNALATVLLLVSMIAVLAAQRLTRLVR